MDADKLEFLFMQMCTIFPCLVHFLSKTIYKVAIQPLIRGMSWNTRNTFKHVQIDETVSYQIFFNTEKLFRWLCT